MQAPLKWFPRVVEVPVTVTLAAYSIGDVVGGLLSCTVPEINGGGYIAWIRLVDDADQKEPFWLWCFYDTPATIANDAAFTMTEADWTKHFTKIAITAADYDATGSEACAIVAGKDYYAADYLLFPPMVTQGLMYFYLQAIDTPDYADADDLTLHIGYMVM